MSANRNFNQSNNKYVYFNLRILINNSNRMPKQVIISMQQDYPFGQCQECTNEVTRVLVRKIYKVNYQERQTIMQKINILRKLKNQHMIKIQSVLQQDQSIHFLFEYIPLKVETWISNINDQFIENFRDQLIKFSSFLANNYIKTDFQLKNIGMDQNYLAKYFLDINFQLEQSANRQKLKSNYIRQITNLFKPYILNNSKVQHNTTNQGRNTKRVETSKFGSEAKNIDYFISLPTTEPQSKKKQKSLDEYYQDVNISVDFQNQKILQEFMDVLENQSEEAITVNSSAKKPQAQNNITSFPQKMNLNYQNSNSFENMNSKRLIYSQKQFTQHHNAQLNFPSNSLKNIQNGKRNVGLSLNSQRQSENVKPLNSTQSMGRGKSQIKNNVSQVWRQSADLQNRVKNAIQKSMDVIKKFKAIRSTYQS